jgi:succinate dehydrogenase / fumarate reductase flavoprotein subunit
LADEISTGAISTKTPEFVEAEKAVRERLEGLFKTTGTETVDTYHKKLGKIIWDYCGMARNKQGLEFAISEIRKKRADVALFNTEYVTWLLTEGAAFLAPSSLQEIA